jgi:hypothetical protein
MKGIAYATIIIIALIGVLMVSVWSYNNLSSGSQFGGTIANVGPKDIAISRLETAKRFLSQDLSYSTQDASLDIANNGGTQTSRNFWFCSNQPVPPETKEVHFAMSNFSNVYLQTYIKGLANSQITQLGVSATEYQCNGIYDSGKETCSQKSSQGCESFQSTATDGGMITVSQPAFVTYSGDLSVDNTNNRFWWIYYRLYDDTKNSLPVRVIASTIRDECTSAETTEQKIEVAIENVCKHYEEVFKENPQYVKCSYEIKCLSVATASAPTTTVSTVFTAPTSVYQNPVTYNPIPTSYYIPTSYPVATSVAPPPTTAPPPSTVPPSYNSVACLNTPCERPPFSETLCYEKTSASGFNTNIFDSLGGKIVSAQASNSLGGVIVVFKLTDNKFNIPSSKGLQPLVWSFWASFDVTKEECRPIDK